MLYWFWPTLWLVMLYCAVFWAIYKLKPSDPWKPKQKLAEPPVWSERAALNRKKASNAEEHRYWTYRFSSLQIEAHKARLMAQQENEIEKEKF